MLVGRNGCRSKLLVDRDGCFSDMLVGREVVDLAYWLVEVVVDLSC
jgi:hypothetical protein